MHWPRTSAEWKAVAADFSSRWNFHHTFGAIDGKHLAIRCPKNGGSLNFNYKGFHSIILFALVDANYKFMWVDVGVNGSSSDALIFNQSELRSGIIDGTLQIPAAEPLPSDDPSNAILSDWGRYLFSSHLAHETLLWPYASR